MTGEPTIKFTFAIDDPELDDERRQKIANKLLREIRDLDEVEKADRTEDLNPEAGNMSESLAATLGELQAQIYWLHDAEKFAELASAAATIYMKLGYTQQQAEIAGNLISQAYQLSDDAVLAQKAGNFDKEMQFYDQVKYKLTQVETTLVYQTSIAIHQMKWWMYFRHRQKLQVLLHLFLQNFKAVGLINLLTAIKLTYFLMEIGRVHKSRDIQTTKHNAIQYWAELLKIKPPQYPYLG